MTMPLSGALNLGGTTSPVSVAQELGLGLTSTISMNQLNVRTLAGVGASGSQWSMSSLYGKTTSFSRSITSNQVNLNLRTWALENGWNGTVPAFITLDAGVYIYSTSTLNAGLTINGSWPGGVTFVNNGYVMGKGGDGGGMCTGNVYDQPAPTSGGVAISIGLNCSIVNNSYIGGGGGGGGGLIFFSGGGGGAGGGQGGQGESTANGSVPGSGGAPGSIGGNGVFLSGGGGGRIFPGTGGAGGIGNNNPLSYGLGGGAGGGGSASGDYYGNHPGSAGGSSNNAAINNTISGAAGGGGWGAAGGSSSGSAQTGGVGGKAIALNGFNATRTGSGSTWGAVS